jgi:hypothetical protein
MQKGIVFGTRAASDTRIIDFQTALELSTAVTLKYSPLEAIKPKRLETESCFLV